MEKVSKEQTHYDSGKGLSISKICRIKNQIIKTLGQNRMVRRIYNGIAQDEFTLFYQPEYNLKTSKVIGVEALVRWISPSKGILTPDYFIPLAEKTELIYELERVIIRKALEQKQIWEKEGLGPFRAFN